MEMGPPKNAVKFLRWFCREDYVEEIEGDLTEIFEKEQKQSPRQAKYKFILSVIKYFRPGFIKPFKRNHQTNHQAMLRHNFFVDIPEFQTIQEFVSHQSYRAIHRTGLHISDLPLGK